MWNIGLRLAGLALIGISAAALHAVVGLMHDGARHAATSLDYLLALVVFGCASGGSVLLFEGTHIFDEIELSERWRQRR